MCKPTTPPAALDSKGRLPPPNFDLKDIRNSIPQHLFHRSLVKSMTFLILDLIYASVMYYIAYTYIPKLPQTLRYIAWPLWWYIQGAILTGVWVIAHECGHQAFSPYGMVNDAVGWVLHSYLLVPYFSWKYTHAQHHSGTSDMARDTVFLPPTKTMVKHNFMSELFGGSPIKTLAGCVVMLLFGWPSYLLANTSGQTYSRWANHFNPNSPCFKPHQKLTVMISDIGIGLVLAGLAYWAYATSVSTVVCYYVVPYLLVNMWLVLITFLQHTHDNVPHYREKEWNFVRGALATVDRDYGFLSRVFHHINDSHVVHHLFSTMPWYNAIQATPYVKEFLGPYYKYEPQSPFAAMYDAWKSCSYVDDEGDVLYYKSQMERKLL